MDVGSSINDVIYDQTYTPEQLATVREIIYSPAKRFIVFDGIIGAGKTTLIKLLHEYYSGLGYKTHPIYEPVDTWQSTGALQHFYEDIPARCYEFQTFTFITRIQRIIDELLKHPDNDIYLLERSIWSDRYIFTALLEGEFGPVRLAMYKQWWSLWSVLVPIKPYKWVLLDTSIDQSFARITQRARNEEKTGVSSDYQNKLALQHKVFFDQLQRDRSTADAVIVINNRLMDANFITNRGVLEKIAHTILTTETKP